jgi:hypothetical protein
MRAAREKLASHPIFVKVALRAGQSALLVGELDEGWEGYQWRKPRLEFERRARRGGTFESPRLPRTIQGAVIVIEQSRARRHALLPAICGGAAPARRAPWFSGATAARADAGAWRSRRCLRRRRRRFAWPEDFILTAEIFRWRPQRTATRRRSR